MKNYGICNNSISFLQRLASEKKVITCLFASPYALNLFSDPSVFASILVCYEDQQIYQDYAAQLIFGAIGAKGHLPVSAGGFSISSGLITNGNLRLKYSIPEELGISSEKLKSIDSIALNAIQNKAFPGCVILAAKNGIVFYYKSFGNFQYDTIHKVEKTDIYDLASVSKISATLPSIMKLYDENRLDIKATLGKYLPDLQKSNKKNIHLIDMLTHQARLQPFIPFYWRLLEPIDPTKNLTSSSWSEVYSIKLEHNLYVNNQIRFKKNLVTSKPDSLHGIKVADSIFLVNSYKDSIFQITKKSNLLPKKGYVYSDLDFYYLFWIVEHITGTSLKDYVQRNFYDKLGASTLGFLPLDKFTKNRIAPTENDLFFRKQLVQGYVHDPGAAMMGGVCGHAGIFSNANDLAKLMQLYLNKGTYGGEMYFKPTTMDYFNSCPFCPLNHRGIGFDKPILHSKNGSTCDCVSASSFGHTGFTGTMTWADPLTGILYIFLSNRVYPNADNIKIRTLNVRTNIQEILSKSNEN